MSERTSGLRSILSKPAAYHALQRALGAEAAEASFVSQSIAAAPGSRLLDIGCGVGVLAAALDDVEYVGFDPSAAYIDSARSRYGTLGTFHVAGVGDLAAEELGTFDVVVLKGVLHHLDDALAASALALGAEVLRAGGRLVTVDPVLAPGQHPVARFLIKRDRGSDVRSPEGYRSLAEVAFASVSLEVRHDRLRVPYSHALMTCTDPIQRPLAR